MASLKGVWWRQFKKSAGSLWRARPDRRIQARGQYRGRNWTWHMEINFQRNWGTLFPLLLRAMLGKPGCWQYMISLNKERSPDLINHCVGRRLRRRTPREVLLFLPLECTASSREDAFIFAVGLCCLRRSLPLSHPFNHRYSPRLPIFLSYSLHFPFINNSVPVGSARTWEAWGTCSSTAAPAKG